MWIMFRTKCTSILSVTINVLALKHQSNNFFRNSCVLSNIFKLEPVKRYQSFTSLKASRHVSKDLKRFYTESGIPKSIASLQAKKRIPRKKKLSEEQLDQETGLVVAYCSADEYDLPRLAKFLENQGLYEQLPLPNDAEDVIQVVAKYKVKEEPRQIFFFSEGTTVFWNVPDIEQRNVLRSLKAFETNPYDPDLVTTEKEDMDYFYSEKGPKFLKGRIILNQQSNDNINTYSFSNGLALSVKLAMWEAALEKYIDSMESVTEVMDLEHETRFRNYYDTQ